MWNCFLLWFVLWLFSDWASQTLNDFAVEGLSRADSPSVKHHFCLFDPKGTSHSLSGLFRINHFLYTRFEFDFETEGTANSSVYSKHIKPIGQTNRGCLYHVFELRRQRFIHHSMKCSDILANETFSRIIGSIVNQNGYTDRIIGYGYGVKSELLYRDFNVHHRANNDPNGTETIEYDILTEPKKLSVLSIDKETLIAVLESNAGHRRRFIALTTMNDRGRSIDQLAEPIDSTIRYRAVFVKRQHEQLEVFNETLSRITSGYQSVDGDGLSWVHLLDTQSNVLTFSMQLVEDAFEACAQCKVVQLDRHWITHQKDSSVVPVKEHLRCSEHMVDTNHHHWEKNTSKLVFIEKNFWASIRDICIWVVIFVGLFLLILAIVSICRKHYYQYNVQI